MCLIVTGKNEVRRWRLGETQGKVVAGGNDRGNRLNQLDYPTFVFVDQDYSVYVSDYNNHRVMKWMEDAKEEIVVELVAPKISAMPKRKIAEAKLPNIKYLNAASLE